MYWYKRSLFLLTLVAFLSNLVVGMTVPTGLKTNANKGSHGLDFIQLKEAQSKSLQISACEFLEEIEELETDTDSDKGLNDFSQDHFFGINSIQNLEFPSPNLGLSGYVTGSFRSWLYCLPIFIFFQVFRI